MEDDANEGYIITKEVFGLNDITRPFAENWVKWANENIDKTEVLQGMYARGEGYMLFTFEKDMEHDECAINVPNVIHLHEQNIMTNI